MKKLLIVMLVLLLVFVVVGLLLPTEYAVAAETTIDAPPEEVHEYVGDLKRWPEWDPWRDMDPTIQTTYGERTTGVGAHQSWTGDKGGGELTLTKADPQQGIAYDMTFVMGDLSAPAKAAMRYEPVDGKTKVVWTIEGDVADMTAPVIGGYVNLMMKSGIASSFHSGLEELKAKVEADEPVEGVAPEAADGDAPAPEQPSEG